MKIFRPYLVGITGGIGSGKSYVVRIFSALGVPTYDSDTRAKELMTEDALLVSEIKNRFGNSTYLADGSLNREFLAGEVFGNKEKLDLLNSLVHPAVGRDFNQWTLAHSEHPYVIKEAALLFETGTYGQLDCTLLVTAPEELRIQRVLQRDVHRGEEQVRQIISRQLPDTEKISLANYTLANDENQLLLPRVWELHQAFLNRHCPKITRQEA